MKRMMLLLFLLFSHSLFSLEHCRQHDFEISRIRSMAADDLYTAHIKGGKLFSISSHVVSAKDRAWYAVEYKASYTEFSAVFRDFLNRSQTAGIPFLQEGLMKNGEMFFDVYNQCIAKHDNLKAYYERGRILFDRGLYGASLADVQHVLERGCPEDFLKGLKQEDVLYVKGQAFLEMGLYNDAICTLSELIKHDPKNKNAYFSRSTAYFEEGQFDESLIDYLMSEKEKELSKIESKAPLEFREALLNALVEGGLDGAKDFVPSLCHSVYGMGTSLWAFTQHPISCTTHFCNSCYELTAAISDQIRNLDWRMMDKCCTELKQLYQNFDLLSEAEKGHLIGYTIGKYGTDILAGGATLKGISALQKIKEANRLCNLEAAVISNANKETIINGALQHKIERDAFFQNIKIHTDRQNKHIPGKHNYEEGKSIFSHQDPEGLLKRFAGKGRPVGGKQPGQSDYREIIDFGEEIGTWKSVDGKHSVITTKGSIRYSKDGAHIVPADPKQW